MVFVARSGYGKSTLMVEFIMYLLETGVIKYKHLILFGKDKESDKPYQILMYQMQQIDKNWKRTNTAESINIHFIKDLFNKQYKLASQHQHYENYLIVFDDQISDEILKTRELDDLFVRARKYGISQIWGLQYFKKNLSPQNREMFTDILLGGMNDPKILESTIMSCCADASLNPKDCLRIVTEFYQKARQTRSDKDGNTHGFLHIRNLVPYGSGKFSINFDDDYLDKKQDGSGNIHQQGIQQITQNSQNAQRPYDSKTQRINE